MDLNQAVPAGCRCRAQPPAAAGRAAGRRNHRGRSGDGARAEPAPRVPAPAPADRSGAGGILSRGPFDLLPLVGAGSRRRDREFRRGGRRGATTRRSRGTGSACRSYPGSGSGMRCAGPCGQAVLAGCTWPTAIPRLPTCCARPSARLRRRATSWMWAAARATCSGCWYRRRGWRLAPSRRGTGARWPAPGSARLACRAGPSGMQMPTGLPFEVDAFDLVILQDALGPGPGQNSSTSWPRRPACCARRAAC